MVTYKERFLSKLPSKQDLFLVLSLIIFIVFTWTLYRMFWYLPSWLYFATIPEVLIFTAYVLVFALFESLIVLGVVILVSLIFPKKIVKDFFTAQATVVIVLVSIAALVFQHNLKLVYKMHLWKLYVYMLVGVIIITILITVLPLAFKRFEKTTRIIRAFLERVSIFSYIYIPLAILSLVVILIRNLF